MMLTHLRSEPAARPRPRPPLRWRGALPLFAALLSAAPLSAQADYILSAPTVAVPVGAAPFEVSISLDSGAGVGVSALQFGLCSDAAVLTPLAVEQGAALQQLNGGNGPDFFSGVVYADGIGTAIIVSFTAVETLPPDPANELIRVTYDPVGSAGDSSALTFCSIGSPPSTVSVVVGGVPVPHETIDGQVVIAVTSLALHTPTGLIAHPASELLLSVRADSSDPVEAFRFGLAHDPSVLELLAIEPGTATALTHGGAGPDQFIVDLSASGPGETGGTVDCVISVAPPFESIPPGDDLEFVRYTYDVAFSATPCTTTTISFTGALGDPPVPLELVAGGSALLPAAWDVLLAVGHPALPLPSGGISLVAEEVTVAPADTFGVSVSLDNDVEVSAFSFGLTFDPTDVAFLILLEGLNLQLTNCGQGPDFFAANTIGSPVSGVTVGCLIALDPPFDDWVLAPNGENELVQLYFVADPSPSGAGTSLTFTEALGDPPVAVEVTVDGAAIAPAAVDGWIAFSGGGGGTDGFRRGECNGDGAVDIADAVYLLGALFPAGGAVPPPLTCEDACDANDDGGLDIADAVALLGSLFLSDPLPGPDSCGPDPTPADALGCDALAPCP